MGSRRHGRIVPLTREASFLRDLRALSGFTLDQATRGFLVYDIWA
jgi:hypothetical protein